MAEKKGLSFSELMSEEAEKSGKQLTNMSKKKAKRMESFAEQKEHQVILAVVGTNQGIAYNFTESDIRKLFTDMPIVDVVTEAGYWIIQFQDDIDRNKALKKNKQVYRNQVTILIDKYSEEDEVVPTNQRTPSRDYSEGSSTRDRFHHTDSYVSKPAANFQFGVSRQGSGRQNGRYGEEPAAMGGFKFGGNVQAPIGGFKIGGNVQAPATSGLAATAPVSYQPPHRKTAPIPQEPVQPTITVKKSGLAVLMSSDGEEVDDE